MVFRGEIDKILGISFSVLSRKIAGSKTLSCPLHLPPHRSSYVPPSPALVPTPPPLALVTLLKHHMINVRQIVSRSAHLFLRQMSTASATAAVDAPVQHTIVEKLTATFTPSHLDVVNESYKHNVPTGSETHFKVTVVSSLFDNQKLIARHRLVNTTLKEELDGPVHALSISAKTPAQWAKTTTLHTTPGCQGGDGSLPKKTQESKQ